MLNKEFILYEQAIALKELGFDEPCFAYYDEEDNTGQIYEYANCSGNVTGDKSCYNDDFLSVTNSQLDKYGAFCSKDEEGEESYERWTAPTFSQAFRWFREKYDFVGTVLGDGFNGKLKGYYYSITEEGWINYYESIDDMKWYDTYEEAELACLNKLIEIVKQK
jgi:hypothetical protein